MTLLILNGSPRQKKSNSKILGDCFIEGYRSVVKKPGIIVHYLANFKKNKLYIEDFLKSNTVLFIFPLYTDAMPGVVKYFLEELYKSKPMRKTNVGFIVQSGFPEAIHSVYLERYLAKYAKRMDFNYLGTIIKGGVEGIQVMPAGMTRKLYANFRQLGRYFAKTGKFDPAVKKRLAKPYKFSSLQRTFFRLMSLTGFTNYYWNMNLKKHGAYRKRHDRPYGEGTAGFIQ
jgi:hypothetical protein